LNVLKNYYSRNPRVSNFFALAIQNSGVIEIDAATNGVFTQKKGKFKKQGAVSQRRDLEFFVLAEARFNASCNIELAWARETPAVPNTTKPRFQIAQDHRCINFFSVDLGESHTLAISSGASDRTGLGRSAMLIHETPPRRRSNSLRSKSQERTSNFYRERTAALNTP